MDKIIAFLVVILAQSLLAGPLHDAAKKGDLAKVKKLLANGANVNEQDFRFMGGSQTPLMNAAYYGRLAVVKELLRAGADVHARTSETWTPLMFAVAGGSSHVVKELLMAGADVNAITEPITYIKPSFFIPSISVLELADHSWKFGVRWTIRKWSIENHILITNAKDMKILDGWKQGSYQRDFAAYQEQMKAIIEKITRIPAKGPGQHIVEYLAKSNRS